MDIEDALVEDKIGQIEGKAVSFPRRGKGEDPGQEGVDDTVGGLRCQLLLKLRSGSTGQN